MSKWIKHRIRQTKQPKKVVITVSKISGKIPIVSPPPDWGAKYSWRLAMVKVSDFD